MVLPVPGSPLTSSGRSSVIAALTAIIRSSVAMYVSVPSNRFIFVLPGEPLRRLLCPACTRKGRLVVHVPQHSGVLASYQLDRFAVRVQYRARSLVAIECGELVAQRGAKADGMSALPFVGRRCDQRTASDGLRNLFDRFRRNPGHVSERDDPAIGVARLRYAMRQARTHSPRRALKHRDLASLLLEQVVKRKVAPTHYRDDVRQHREQITSSMCREGYAVIERMQ